MRIARLSDSAELRLMIGVHEQCLHTSKSKSMQYWQMYWLARVCVCATLCVTVCWMCVCILKMKVLLIQLCGLFMDFTRYVFETLQQLYVAHLIFQAPAKTSVTHSRTSVARESFTQRRFRPTLIYLSGLVGPQQAVLEPNRIFTKLR